MFKGKKCGDYSLMGVNDWAPKKNPFKDKGHTKENCLYKSPVYNLLQKTYPEALMVAMGVAGPNSNPHDIDEKLTIFYARRFTMTLSAIIGGIGMKEENEKFK
jgi:hypothetical protein